MTDGYVMYPRTEETNPDVTNPIWVFLRHEKITLLMNYVHINSERALV